MKMVNSRKPNIALITLPVGNNPGKSFVTKSLKLLEPLCNELFLVTGNFPTVKSNKIRTINIKCPKRPGADRAIWDRVLGLLLIQLRLSLKLTQISPQTDIVIFHLGGELNLLPIFCAKALRKKTVMFYYGVQKSREMKYNEPFGMGGLIFPFVAKVLENIIFRLVDRIVVEAETAIKYVSFGVSKSKVSADGAFYVDANCFRLERELNNRRKLVGFIGSLVPVKGVINFVESLPLILRQLPDVEFLVGGSGPLSCEIEDRLEKDGLSDKVSLTGWLSRDAVVGYLNQMKLLVLPSYLEGLPNIVLEAMACGTPVLATAVGGIPDVIEDEKTGFILRDNSAESISRGVLRALNHPQLLEITRNASALIESKYSYPVAVQRFRNILVSLC